MTYDYSNVQINLPDSLSRRIIRWGKESIPDTNLSNDPNNRRSGREEEMHVTLLYGIHSGSPGSVRSLFSGVKPFTVELGKVGLFTLSDSFDVVKIGVKCAELHELNAKLRQECEYTCKFDTYRPHVTVAYIQKGRGWKLDGVQEFEGELFEAKEVVFSSKSGLKTPISLT